MKRIWLLGLLVQPALCASFPLDPASARITEQEERHCSGYSLT